MGGGGGGGLNYHKMLGVTQGHCSGSFFPIVALSNRMH